MATKLDELVVSLKADIRGLQAGLATATADIRKFTGQAEQHVTGLQSAIGRARTAFLAFGGAWAAFRVGQNLFTAGVQMDALNGKMRAALVTSEQSAQGLAYVRAESERLGLRFLDTANSFANFAAAGTRAGLTLQQVQEIFTGVSEASVAFRLSNERVNLVFQALQQIAAKGVVSMEELRQQLGESLPVAMEAAARGMGVTQAELIKMIERGDVAAKDFLPRFGAAIRANLGDAVTQASQSAQANLNRTMNSVDNLKASVAGGGFMYELSQAFKAASVAINTPALQEGLRLIGALLGNIVRIAAEVVAGFAIMIQSVVEFAGKAKSLLFMGNDQRLNRGATNTMSQTLPEMRPVNLNSPVQGGPGMLLAPLGESEYAPKIEAMQAYHEQALELETTFQDQLGSIRMEAMAKQGEDLQAGLEGFLGTKIAIQDKTFAEQGRSFRDSITQAANYNKTMFQISKAAALAEAVLSARQAVVDAYAWGTKLGGPALGAAFAGVAAAAQAANIAAIASASFGSTGGTGSSSGGSIGESSITDTNSNAGTGLVQPKQVYINLQGDDAAFFSKNNVRKLIEQINDAVGDGSRLVVAVS